MSGSYFISTDRDLLNTALVYSWLRDQTYWAKELPEERFLRSVRYAAFCYGVYRAGAEAPEQVGFARVISDRATFAYLTDVYIDAAFRGLGLSRLIMEAVMAEPELQGLRRFLLVTEEAEGLYAKYGFERLADAEQWMQRFSPNYPDL